jgi:hypothetical protein
MAGTDEENLSQEKQSQFKQFELGTSQMQVRYVTPQKTCSRVKFYLPALTTKIQYILTHGTTLHIKITPQVTNTAPKTTNGHKHIHCLYCMFSE